MFPYQPYQQFQQPFQPQQQVLRANGKASVDAIKLAPNSSVLVMDTTAPLVWLCASDSLGNVTSTAYDIAPHQEAPPVDMNSLEARLAALEKKMEGMNNDKPDAWNADPKSNGRLAESDTAHQASPEHGAVSQQPVRYAESSSIPES